MKRNPHDITDSEASGAVLPPQQGNNTSSQAQDARKL